MGRFQSEVVDNCSAAWVPDTRKQSDSFDFRGRDTMKTISRVMATGAAVFAITVGSSLFTGTANATATQCEAYLQMQGYTVSSTMSSACWKGQRGFVRLCQNDLVSLGVIAGHAGEACRRAAM